VGRTHIYLVTPKEVDTVNDPRIDEMTEEPTMTAAKVVVTTDEMIEVEMRGEIETIDGPMTDIDVIDAGRMTTITEIETDLATIDTANEDTIKTTEEHEVGAQSTEKEGTTTPTENEVDEKTVNSRNDETRSRFHGDGYGLIRCSARDRPPRLELGICFDQKAILMD
jgi:hypothetical protein